MIVEQENLESNQNTQEEYDMIVNQEDNAFQESNESIQSRRDLNEQENNEFCRLCDQFQQKYGKMTWVNIVYVALIVCIMIFILSLLFSAPPSCWVLLIIFITIWIFRNRDVNTGLFLLALFLLILLLVPTQSEINPTIVLSAAKK